MLKLGPQVATRHGCSKGSRGISAAHLIPATCCVHFRMPMYAISTWLIILGRAGKPCSVGAHVQSKMNVLGTAGGHGMGGGDTPASLQPCLMPPGLGTNLQTKHQLKCSSRSQNRILYRCNFQAPGPYNMPATF